MRPACTDLLRRLYESLGPPLSLPPPIIVVFFIDIGAFVSDVVHEVDICEIGGRVTEQGDCAAFCRLIALQGAVFQADAVARENAAALALVRLSLMMLRLISIDGDPRP